MSFINVFFVVLSVFVIVYLINVIASKKRTSFLFEFFFLIVYAFVAFIFLFPGFLDWLENFLGISSAINFFLYLAIFVILFILLKFYRKMEEQRKEITKLAREIAKRK
ncbi:MAG: DUF2304 family protein [Nanobdellota archaeon]